MTKCNLCKSDMLKWSRDDFLCKRCEPQCPPDLLKAYRKKANDLAFYRRINGLMHTDKAPEHLTDACLDAWKACRTAMQCTAV